MACDACVNDEHTFLREIAIGATKVAHSSEISDRGHFVANFVYFFHIFLKKYLNIFEKERFL